MAVPITVAMQNAIAQNYIAILGRNPDAAGFSFWLDVYANANATPAALTSITNGFGNSAEFRGTYGSLSTEAAIGLMYQNVLLRAADAGGLAYWTNYANNLISSGQTISNAYAQTGAQIIYNASSQGQSDAAGINARTATAVAAGTTAPVTTYTLTTGVSSYTGGTGNDIFVGTIDAAAGASSFTTGLSIDGGSGINTLRLNDVRNGGAGATTVPTPTGLTLTNVQNLVVNADVASTSLAGTISGAAWSGVTSATFNAVSNAVVAGRATTALTVNASAAVQAGTTSIDGGLSQGGTITGAVLTNGQTGSAVTLGGTTATTGAVNLTVSNSTATVTNGQAITGGRIIVNGGSTVTVNQTIAVTTAAATGAVVTLTQGRVDVNGTASTTSATINQTAAQTAAAVTATTDSPTVVAGATNVLDANRASTTAAGTITSVTLNNSGAAVVNSGALTTLNLAGTLTTVDLGTLGALTTAANTALAVNLSGAVSTGALTIDTDITTINITGTGTANTIADLVNASATAVNIGGTVGVTITANTLAAAVVITSTNTAGTTLTQALTANQQFVGGDGADSISIGQTTKAINMGGGNDTVIISNETLGTGGTLNGGAGTNTIVANTNSSTLSANANITNFTTLRVAGAAAQGAHNATGFTALEVGLTGTNLAGAMSFTNVAAGTTLRYLATTGQTSAYVLANATGTTDVLNVTLSSNATITTGALTAAGIETVNITNTDTLTTTASGINTNVMTLTAAAAKTIVVTGNAGLNLTATGSTAVTRFDASGVTGLAANAAALAVTYASLNATTTAAVAITGGAGNDLLTGNAAIDTINGGLGNDTIDGGTGADVIDGGAGTNTFVAVATNTASVEGAGTGTTAGMAINLGTANVTAATINAALTTVATATVGLSAASAGLAAGSAQYIFATQSNLFATTADTLANIQNITGSAGRDYIVGSNGVANTINAGAGADTVIITETTSAVDTLVQVRADGIATTAASNAAAAAIANNDTITFGNGVDIVNGFVSGTDKIDTTTANTVTALAGVNGNANLVAASNNFVIGTYVAATGVFTVNTAATAATANVATLVIADASAAAYTAAGQTGTILLIGTAGVVAADFI